MNLYGKNKMKNYKNHFFSWNKRKKKLTTTRKTDIFFIPTRPTATRLKVFHFLLWYLFWTFVFPLDNSAIEFPDEKKFQNWSITEIHTWKYYRMISRFFFQIPMLGRPTLYGCIQFFFTNEKINCCCLSVEQGVTSGFLK